VTFAQTWFRQALGATGASLLVPVAVLLAAGVLAAGGGLGSLSEFGQITSGPTLPEPDLATGGSAIEDADIVGADLSSPAGGVASAPPGAATGTPGELPVGPGGVPLPSPLTEVPSGPGAEPGPPGGPVTAPGQPPALGTPGGPAQGPTGTTVEGVKPLVPEPVQPVAEDILNLLLGPQP
jgi:hypothetical protein